MYGGTAGLPLCLISKGLRLRMLKKAEPSIEVLRGLELIVSAALAAGSKRSQAYRLGVFDSLHSCMTGGVVLCPYREGSPKCDAYISGLERGNHLWLDQYDGGSAFSCGSSRQE